MTRRVMAASTANRSMIIRILGASPMDVMEGVSPEPLQEEPSGFLRADSLLGPYYGLPSLEQEHYEGIISGGRPLEGNGKSHSLALLSRNALRNSAAVINRLPIELLVNIMELVQVVTGLGSFGPIHWLRLLRVCRHWFVVGATAPALWSRIFVRKSLNYARIALARSKKATVSCSIYNPYLVSKALPLLLPHIYRLRELVLDWEDISYIDSNQFLAFLGEGMPALEVLTTRMRCYRASSVATLTDQARISFTSVRFPRLRDLTITGAYVAKSSIWEQLHTLCLKECLEMSMDLLTETLTECKNIVRLEILDTTMLPEQGRAPALLHSRSLAPLPKLQELRIRVAQTWAIKHVLSVVLIPASAQVTLEWFLHNGTSKTDIKAGLLAGLPDDFSSLPILASEYTTQAEVELSYEQRSLKLTRVEALEEGTGAEHAPVSGSISMSVCSRNVLHANDALEIMQKAPLETLRIALGGFRLEYIDWRALFQPFDALHRLTVVVHTGRILYPIIRTLFSALDVQNGEGGRSQFRGVPCPSLRYLRLEGIETTCDSRHREELAYARECLLRRQMLLDRTTLDELVLVVSTQDRFEECRRLAADLLAPVVGSLEYHRNPDDNPDSEAHEGARRKRTESDSKCTIS
ncbi:hypothetical protein GY45DRAFT_250457 [Cubamyces sp. BRFM 1775]|nr:hypothetical protein GY45DRAFT_250457 [Cubamyces sp. BRFM 1775]